MRKLSRVSVSRADMKVGGSKACFMHVQVIIGENVCVLSPTNSCGWDLNVYNFTCS